jgi:hypothetical protein
MNSRNRCDRQRLGVMLQFFAATRTNIGIKMSAEFDATVRTAGTIHFDTLVVATSSPSRR